MTTPLVLLAAGLGRRFGGPKQLAEVGPNGEPLFIVTARRALDAGFGRILVVTRAELADELDQVIKRHLRGGPIEIVLQDASGPTRPTPWGTAHAVAVCAPLVDGPLGVANADDHYGGESIGVLAGAVAADGLAPTHAVIVGHRLGDTLSEEGPVNRAVCTVDAAGRVTAMVECFGLERVGDEVRDAEGTLHPADAVVSMNLLGLGAGVVQRLARRFAEFAAAHADDGVEMVLPTELASMLDAGEITVRCIPTTGHWAGLTHRGDLEPLRRVVARDLAEGARKPDVRQADEQA
ncbi:MAG: NTP transferase domain-containing protein [Acidimicrobiales bacterium]